MRRRSAGRRRGGARQGIAPPECLREPLGGEDEARINRNLWPLVQHDVSAFDGAVPHRHGVFGSDDTTTLARHAASQDAWLGDPEALFPYLIVVDGGPAGLELVAARPRLPRGIEADFVVHEFFVLHAYRGSSAPERRP